MAEAGSVAYGGVVVGFEPAEPGTGTAEATGAGALAAKGTDSDLDAEAVVDPDVANLDTMVPD